MKQKYGRIKMAESFIKRSIPTARSYIPIYSFFLILGRNYPAILLVAILLIINALTRLFVISNYKNKKLCLEKTVRTTFYQIGFNSVGWGILLSLVFWQINIGYYSIMAAFISFIFLANSIYLLSFELYLVVLFVLSNILPILFKTYQYYLMVNDSNILLFILLFVIYLMYVLRQSKRLHNEEKYFYENEFELIRNVRKLKRAKEELEENTLLAFHNDRLISLGEMASSIAHEINNPLTIINGNTMQILRRESETDPLIIERAKKIHLATDRITKIINSMRLFSNKADISVNDNILLGQILLGTLNLSENKFKATNIDLKISEYEDCLIRCNFVQISQILVNLLNNAVDALVECDIENKFIHIDIKDLSDKLSITIINNGGPIPSHIRNKIFSPFFTSKPIGKGTGLGLSISRKLAEKNHGSLEYKEIHGNTAFELILAKY